MLMLRYNLRLLNSAADTPALQNSDGADACALCTHGGYGLKHLGIAPVMQEMDSFLLTELARRCVSRMLEALDESQAYEL